MSWLFIVLGVIGVVAAGIVLFAFFGYAYLKTLFMAFKADNSGTGSPNDPQ